MTVAKAAPYIGLGLALLSANCDSTENRPQAMTLVSSPVILGSAERSYQPTAEDDALLLARPTDMVASGDTLIIVDNGNSRLVFVDTAFGLLAFVGSEGSGPGELEGVFNVAATPGRIFVNEITNGRISIFSTSGDYERSVRLPIGGTPFAVTSDETIITYAGDPSWIFRATRKDGQSHPLVAWSKEDDPGSEIARLSGARAPFVVVDDLDNIHVFDNASGVLSRYSPSGDLLLRRRLPSSINDAIEKDNAAIAKDFGGRVVALPLAKSMGFTPEGHILLLLIADDIYGLAIEPTSYAARPVVVDHTANPDHVRNASAAVFVGNTMFTLANGSVYATRWPGLPDVASQ